MLAHLARERLSSRPLLIPNVPKRRRYPRYFTRDEQELLFALLCERDQLAMEWALYTGAREFEICALTTAQIPPQSAYRHRRVYALPLRVTKGDVPGDLWVPTWLLKKTYQYIHFYGRQGAVSASERFGRPTSENIFLSRCGDALNPDTLYRGFKTAVERAGLRGTFHHLRHTYAISMLHKLMQTARFRDSDGHNALLVLRDLMRHGSVVTTEIYLVAWRRYLTEVDANLFDMPEHYATTA
jgi:integrase